MLDVKNLKVHFKVDNGVAKAVDGVSFSLAQKETLSLVGESGCGKSMTALSIIQLVPGQSGYDGHQNPLSGSVRFNKKELNSLPESQKHEIRGDQIAMVFQEPMKSLNPVLSIGFQLIEPLKLHQNLNQQEAKTHALELLDMVRIPNKEQCFNDYPHQLSGGMRQRVMIAIAIACDPMLLIADEPTAALDSKTEKEVLDLLKEIQQAKQMAMLLITHDLAIAEAYSDRIAVMYAGRIVEHTSAKEIFKKPSHPYTVKLLKSLPSQGHRKYYLDSIEGRVPPADAIPPGCRFARRCHVVYEDCYTQDPRLIPIPASVSNTKKSLHEAACLLYYPIKKQKRKASEKGHAKRKGSVSVRTGKRELREVIKKSKKTYLEVKGLKVYFPIRKGFLKKTVGYVKAVDGVSLKVPKGTTLALVGSSGCGKTTLGRALLQLIPVSGGKIIYEKKDILSLPDSEKKVFRSKNQIIFQDPFSSLNPKMMVGNIVSEGIQIHKNSLSKAERNEKIEHFLDIVGLDPKMKNRYPHEFSGGQRQRIGIARSLILEPEFIVCDEVTSALDVSVQAQILNLLLRLQHKLRLTYLFITHNQEVVKYVADSIVVMEEGKIIDTEVL